MGLSSTSIITQAGPIGTYRAIEESAEAVAVQLAASAAKLHRVTIDNLLGTQVVYVNFFDVLSASVTLGTTIPDTWIPCPVGVKLTWSLRDLTNNTGLSFGTALTMATTTVAGGNVSPTIKPVVTVDYS